MAIAPSVASSSKPTNALAMTALPILTAMAMPEAAHASVSPVASAFAAYGHYLGLVLIAATLTTEKFLIKPELTEEEAKKLVSRTACTASRASSSCTPATSGSPSTARAGSTTRTSPSSG